MNTPHPFAPAALAAILSAMPAHAQNTDPPSAPASAPPDPTPATPAAEPKVNEGILPLPDYTGDFWTRRYLSGDWGGTRSDLARKGLTFEIDWTQVGQGVVGGGRRIDWDYGGSLDYVLSADLQRMGVMPGGLFKLRAETRYAESVNDDSGAVLPVNTDAFFPLTSRTNEGIPVAITELTYTQFFSAKFGVVLGKMQTLDGDPNEFASGRGRSQFMNSNFVFNPAGALTVPYSTLGGGVIWLPTDKVQVTSILMNTTDSSTTSGFDHIEDGWTWSAEADFQYRLGTLPGGMNAGAAYAFAGNFNRLGGKLQLIPGQGVQLPEQSDSWFVYWSAWQYIYTPDEAPARINQGDARPDLRGLGLFARAGFADQDTNPIDWTASVGLGGRGLIPGRDNDTFGVAFVFTDLQSTRIFRALNIEGSTQAVEAFYDIAVTPAIDLTLDAQWIDGGSQNVSEAKVIGVRVNVKF